MSAILAVPNLPIILSLLFLLPFTLRNYNMTQVNNTSGFSI